PQPCEKGGERDVALEAGRELGGALHLCERVDAAQAPAVEKALLAHRIDRAKSRSLEQSTRDPGFAVDKLGTELDGDRKARHAPRPAAPADPLARLEHQRAAALARELVGR